MLILAVLILPVVLGMVALAVEGGLWYADRHDLRTMADSAAMAAGWARRDLEDEDDSADVAATELGFDAATDSLVVNSPPSQGDYTDDDNAIEVIVQRTRPLMLSTLFLDDNSVEIVMRAVAQVQQISAACVLALNSSGSGAISVKGSAELEMNGCGMTANSNDDEAIQISGSATVEAPYLKTQGDIDISKPEDQEIDSQLSHSSPTVDPFADVEVTPPAGCSYTNYKAQNATPTVPAPGSTFCSGFTVTANGDLTLAAGTYYITSGDFKLNGGATLNGTGVTFVLTGDACADINGGANFNVSAPTAGALAGLVFFSDSTCSDAKINGGASMNVDGALYFPDQDVTFTGNSSSGGGCLRIIGDTVEFGGSAAMGNDCTAYGLPMTDNADPRLVE